MLKIEPISQRGRPTTGSGGSGRGHTVSPLSGRCLFHDNTAYWYLACRVLQKRRRDAVSRCYSTTSRIFTIRSRPFSDYLFWVLPATLAYLLTAERGR